MRGLLQIARTVCYPKRTPFGRKPCYVLKVRGESMIEEGIPDGDYVVIEQRNAARNGEFVVALVRNEEVTLTCVAFGV